MTEPTTRMECSHHSSKASLLQHTTRALCILRYIYFDVVAPIKACMPESCSRTRSCFCTIELRTVPIGAIRYTFSCLFFHRWRGTWAFLPGCHHCNHTASRKWENCSRSLLRSYIFISFFPVLFCFVFICVGLVAKYLFADPPCGTFAERATPLSHIPTSTQPKKSTLQQREVDRQDVVYW